MSKKRSAALEGTGRVEGGRNVESGMEEEEEETKGTRPPSSETRGSEGELVPPQPSFQVLPINESLSATFKQRTQLHTRSLLKPSSKLAVLRSPRTHQFMPSETTQKDRLTRQQLLLIPLHLDRDPQAPLTLLLRPRTILHIRRRRNLEARREHLRDPRVPPRDTLVSPNYVLLRAHRRTSLRSSAVRSRFGAHDLLVREGFGAADDGAHPVGDELVRHASDRGVDALALGVEVDNLAETAGFEGGRFDGELFDTLVKSGEAGESAYGAEGFKDRTLNVEGGEGAVGKRFEPALHEIGRAHV